MARTYGDLCHFRMADYPIYLLNHPLLVEQSLIENAHHLRKPHSIVASNRGHWGDGLTSLDGPAWKERKRSMRPLFHRRELENWAPIIVECTEDMLAQWSDGEEIQLFQELVDLRARIASRIVLGVELEEAQKAGKRDTLPIDEARGTIFTLTEDDGQCPFVGMRRPRAARDVKHLVELTRRRAFQRGESDCLVSQLVRKEPGLGRPETSELIDEILQLFFAGHLTVTSWLARFWCALWLYPHVEAQVFSEATRVLGKRSASLADLQALPFAVQALRETGRVLAPAPVLYREVAASFRLGSHWLEEDSGLWIAPQLLHHDPRFFKRPAAFEPERFNPGGTGEFPRYAYLPFGAGPRICIARFAAMMEMQLVVATICRAFQLIPRLPSQLRSRGLLAIPPAEKIVAQLKRRED